MGILTNLAAFLFTHELGDLWSWVTGVFGRVGDISIYWLLAALALKTAESALVGVSWRNILIAAYPRSRVPFRIAWAASQGGAAINAVTPSQLGTVAMIGIFRKSIPGSTVAGVTTAAVIQTLFFTVVSALMVVGVAISRPEIVSRGSLSDEAGDKLVAHPVLMPVIAVAILVIARFVSAAREAAAARHLAQDQGGAGIFRDWRRYLTHVALPSAASYACRVAVNVVFMAAFDIPITAFTVLAVAASHMLCGIFAVTPGGVGEAQALDVFALRGHSSPGAIAAFSDHGARRHHDLERRARHRARAVGVRLLQARQLFSRSGDGKSHQPAPRRRLGRGLTRLGRDTPRGSSAKGHQEGPSVSPRSCFSTSTGPDERRDHHARNRHARRRRRPDRDRPRRPADRVHDALVRVTRAAVCGSDLWPYKSMEHDDAGRRMGHEFIGVVEDVGADVGTVKAGDLVVAPFLYSDGICVFCREGLHTSCLHGGRYGFGDVDGGQGEAVRVPYADGTLVVLPVGTDDALMPSLLTLTDVMATGHHAAVSRAGRPRQDRRRRRRRRGRACAA